MKRRDVLKLILGGIGSLSTGSFLRAGEDDDSPLYAGWVDDATIRDRFIQRHRRPFLSQYNSQIKDTGKGRKVFLWKAYEQVTGWPLQPHKQTVGDCVGQAFGLGIDVLTAVRIASFNMPERWVAKAATEIIYAGARIETGGMSRRKLTYDGTTGTLAAEFCRDWGVLLRQSYLDGEYDFTTYSGAKARQMGRYGAGVPDALEPLCKLHPLQTCTLVRSWEECRDAVANGYPVVMCCNIGFWTKRDKDGFLRRRRKPWYHAQVILGVDDEYRRPGALVVNSWGENWVSGPTRHEQPAGSYWCDAATVDAAMKQGDSIALSGYVGYPQRDVPDYILW
ncbi:MAG: hypothetical protein AMS22_05070 [Thiotrichales bacterium SG8_50]|nr:MAG: hypothetical protein AMS22_05070 [Thiotrichales bacterium SG8_50]